MTTQPSTPAVPARPRLRMDVVLGPAQRRGDTVIHHVKDRLTGGLYRVGRREYFLMSRMDGRRSLHELELEYGATFNRRLGPAHWQQVFTMLHSRQLLDGVTDGAALARLKESVAATNKRSRRGPLAARIPLVDPDRLLDRLVVRAGAVFAPWFVLPALLLVVGVQALVLTRWRQLLDDAGGGPHMVLSAILAMMLFSLVVTVHELAHALTLKRFGGSVPEIGLLWRFPLLAAYCKTDDVVLLPVRPRVYTAFAGVFAGLLALVPVAAVWLLSPAGGLGRSVTASVLLFGSVTGLLNLIPFLRLDGYHALTYALNLVDLRTESYRFWARLVRGGPAAVRGYRRHDRIAYGLYGIATVGFTFGAGTLLVRLWYAALSGWVGPRPAVAILVGEGTLVAAYVGYALWRRRR